MRRPRCSPQCKIVHPPPGRSWIRQDALGSSLVRCAPVTRRKRTNGPNFNVKVEKKQDVLFAIRNGGFSGAIMPANIVVGDDAQKVAEFLAKYAGRDAAKPVTPQSGGATP